MHPPSKRLIFIQILLIFVLPVFLIYFNILSESWRLFFLCTSALLIYGIIRYEKWDYYDLGLRHDNIRDSLPYYVGITALFVVSLFLIDSHFNLNGEISREFLYRTLLFFIPVSFFQEFAFAVFLIPRLQLIFKKSLAVVISVGILFSLIHIIYPDIAIGLPVSFIGGAVFTWVYLKHPNFLLIGLAHSVINFTAVLLGFFSIQ